MRGCYKYSPFPFIALFQPIHYSGASFYFTTTIWTVDLLMPNLAAAARTVVRFSMM